MNIEGWPPQRRLTGAYEQAENVLSRTLEPISKSIFDEEATLTTGINGEQHAESLEITQFVDAVTLKGNR